MMHAALDHQIVELDAVLEVHRDEQEDQRRRSREDAEAFPSGTSARAGT